MTWSSYTVKQFLALERVREEMKNIKKIAKETLIEADAITVKLALEKAFTKFSWPRHLYRKFENQSFKASEIELKEVHENYYTGTAKVATKSGVVFEVDWSVDDYKSDRGQVLGGWVFHQGDEHTNMNKMLNFNYRIDSGIVFQQHFT